MDELDCIIDDLIPHKKSTAQQRYKLLAGLSAINNLILLALMNFGFYNSDSLLGSNALS